MCFLFWGEACGNVFFTVRVNQWCDAKIKVYLDCVTENRLEFLQKRLRRMLLPSSSSMATPEFCMSWHGKNRSQNAKWPPKEDHILLQTLVIWFESGISKIKIFKWWVRWEELWQDLVWDAACAKEGLTQYMPKDSWQQMLVIGGYQQWSPQSHRQSWFVRMHTRHTIQWRIWQVYIYSFLL